MLVAIDEIGINVVCVTIELVWRDRDSRSVVRYNIGVSIEVFVCRVIGCRGWVVCRWTKMVPVVSMLCTHNAHMVAKMVQKRRIRNY